MLAALLLAVACGKKETSVEIVDFPFPAAVPYVTGAGMIGFIDEKTKSFRLVTYDEDGWSPPRTIATDPALLINRADHPTIEAYVDELVATWSRRKAHGSVVLVAKSIDGGLTWSTPQTPHPDVVSQFGFTAQTRDEFVYLDGRKLDGGMEGNGEMELRAGDGTLLDPRVCDCCQTAIAMTGEGSVVVAYRDRSADEVRDISIVRKTESGWTQPKTLHADGWKIAGCPVNGPQLDADGKRVVAAWFTAANGDPRVYVAVSEDSGTTFSKPVRIDEGSPAGRVDVVLVADGAAVTWVAQKGGKSTLHARRIDGDGSLGKSVSLGEASGFPRAARWGENVVAVVWSSAAGARLAVIERL
ncbi:MAG TPA: sialidase family protein [Thermoanaerobaculia bacterium]|nr:sialidase family protein [Thermoanaerobaculia bacterium]